MRRLLCGLMLGGALAGCSKDAKYKAACEHLIELGKADLEGNLKKIGDPTVTANLRERAAASSKSDLETCTSKAAERGLDTGCVLDAKTLDEALPCLRVKQ